MVLQVYNGFIDQVILNSSSVEYYMLPNTALERIRIACIAHDPQPRMAIRVNRGFPPAAITPQAGRMRFKQGVAPQGPPLV